jgi:hypothetical protein
VVKGTMSVILGPFGFSKTTMEAASGPVGDTIDVTVDGRKIRDRR